jgi:ubiquinone/menaquinone biosynthesis C-methylase UbiE
MKSFLSVVLRVFFRLLYHPFAWTYDSVAAIVSVGQWRTWVMSVMPDLTGPRVLELGHGPGHLQARLQAEGRQAYGLDESRQMGRLARQRLQQKGFIPCLARGIAQALPYPAGTFQQVVATFPTEYIADPRTLMEIYRVLAQDGEAVLLLLAWITDKRWYGRLAAWLFRVTGQAPVAWDDRHLEAFQRIGFQSRAEQLSLKSSTLLIVHLRKPVNSHGEATQMGYN